MKYEISSISVTYDTGCQTWVVGHEGVTEIKDLSREFPDHTEYEFEILGEDKRTKTKLIGGHIIVNYK